MMLLLLCAPVVAVPRGTALVIGNAAYEVGRLRNPVNDATDMTTALRELGFTVTPLYDADLRTMQEAIAAFSRAAGTGGVGLFYFAGHGLQVQGQNYLLPIGARIESEADVRFQAIPAEWVLDKMQEAGRRMHIIILDACRNNPYARQWRSPVRGLAKMQEPVGSLVAYATAPGSVAEDGTGRNGVYTKHLLHYLRTPGLKVEDVFKKVRIAVREETRQKQTPWESSSLVEDFVFVPAAGEARPSPTSGAAALPPDASARERAHLLTKVAGYLVEKIADYTTGKAFDAVDRRLGENYKTELQQQRDALRQVASTSESARLELRAVENQMQMLEVLLHSTPTKEQLHAFKTQIDNDLQLVMGAMREQNRRSEELERVVMALREELKRPTLQTVQRPLSPVPAKTSFDCAKARTDVEITICNDPRLASVDGRLGEVYWAVRRALPQDQSERLRKEQIAWIKERDYLLSRVCITGGKIDTHCAVFFWELRIAQLESLRR